MKNPSAISWSKWTLVLCALIAGVFSINQGKWKKQSVIQTDAFVYYSYLPATFIYQDWNFDFYDELNSQGVKGEFWTLHAPNGKRVQKMSMGTAYLYLPFFVISHVYAIFTDQANGYSPPYHAGILLAAWFYTLMALVILRAILLEKFEERSVAIAIAGVWLGTNLFHYTSVEAGMSHAYSFFLFASFFRLSQNLLIKPKWHSAIWFGACAGLIVLVRPTNIIVGLVPLLMGVDRMSELKDRLLSFITPVQKPLKIVLGVLIVWLPQLIYWKTQTDHWWWYSYQDEGFFWTDPKIMDALFSYRKGWFLYTPIAAIAFLGVRRLFQIKHETRWIVASFFPLYLYITFSWWCWWYGGSFGQRSMIETYALLIFPFAALIEYLLDKLKGLLVIGLTLVLVAHNQFETFQYKKTLIHWDSMTKEAYWSVFLKTNFPPDYADLIETPDYEAAKKGDR